MSASQVLFLALTGLVAIERLVELRVSTKNARRALAQGAVETGRGHYPFMVAMHTAFLVAAPLEVLLLDRPFSPLPAALMVTLVLLAQALRWWTIHTLGDRWTTRIICRPGDRVVKGGPFRFLRHPNYLAVVIEMLALPMVHNAFVTAILFFVLNGLVLRARVAAEEEALGRLTDWDSVFSAGRERGRAQ